NPDVRLLLSLGLRATERIERDPLSPRFTDTSMQKVGTAGIPSEQAQEQDPVPRQSSRGNRRSNREDTPRGRRGRRSDPIPWPVSRATHSRQDTNASPDLCSTRILSSSGRDRPER